MSKDVDKMLESACWALHGADVSIPLHYLFLNMFVNSSLSDNELQIQLDKSSYSWEIIFSWLKAELLLAVAYGVIGVALKNSGIYYNNAEGGLFASQRVDMDSIVSC